MPAPVYSFGGPGRTRTSDLRFRRPSLYPLSYGATSPPIIPREAVPFKTASDSSNEPLVMLRHHLS